MDVALFKRVGGKCLNCAANLLDAEKTPTAGTVGAVGKLVDVAIAVERLNLPKIEQSSTAALKLEDEKPEEKPAAKSVPRLQEKRSAVSGGAGAGKEGAGT